MADSLKPLQPPPERTVTVVGYAFEDMFIEVREVVGQTGRGRYMMGSTPAPDTIINTLTFDQLDDANLVGAFLWLHHEILQNVQRNNPRPAVAEGVVTVQVGAQQVRLAPPPQFCFLDQENPKHLPAFEYAKSQVPTLVVATALCAGLDSGNPIGLTAVFADPSEIDLSQREVESNIDSIMSIFEEAPLFGDPDRFAAEAVRRFNDSDERNLARFRAENIFVKVGTDARREDLYMLGATPLRDMILQTLVLAPVTEREGVAFYSWLQAQLLGSARDHSASRPIAGSN